MNSLNVGFYRAKEIMDDEEELQLVRYLVVTESVLLIFEPHISEKNLGTLISWSALTTLMKIRTDFPHPEMIELYWKNQGNNENWVMKLHVERRDAFINACRRNLKKYSRAESKKNKNRLQLADVSLPQLNIEQLKAQIEAEEEQLDEEVSLETVQVLMSLYQKAIEYFSAFDEQEKEFMFFKNKLTSMLMREDVNKVFK